MKLSRLTLAPRLASLAFSLLTFAGTAADPNQTHGLSPQESLARFKVAEDLALDQVLAEPLVRQPVFMNFDERGRLWVVQYIQYPHPAGLKVLSRD